MIKTTEELLKLVKEQEGIIIGLQDELMLDDVAEVKKGMKLRKYLESEVKSSKRAGEIDIYITMLEELDSLESFKHCPECGTSQMLCGYNGYDESCTSGDD